LLHPVRRSFSSFRSFFWQLTSLVATDKIIQTNHLCLSSSAIYNTYLSFFPYLNRGNYLGKNQKWISYIKYWFLWNMICSNLLLDYDNESSCSEYTDTIRTKNLSIFFSLDRLSDVLCSVLSLLIFTISYVNSGLCSKYNWTSMSK
jgi:hypothetical protein